MECKEPVRLQKYIASCGIASRRRAEELILGGSVTVNGRIVTELGTKVFPGMDIVKVDGRTAVQEQNPVYIALNKPAGYVTTVRDQFGRPAVTDLVQDIPERIYPVGRLDYESSGLLLLTNDGELDYRLTHPKYGHTKTYIVTVSGSLTDEQAAEFESGMEIEGYKTAPARLTVLSAAGGASIVRIVLSEGRNRQIRKMMEKLGHEVIKLERVAFGPVELGTLQPGTWRHLTQQEITALKS